MANQLPPAYHRGSGLVDVLDRVLDKGLVVAGDIKIALAEVELLTIRIRLIVCSIDKAEEVGLDWWKRDRYFGGALAASDDETLRLEIRSLQRKIAELESDARSSRGASPGSKPQKKGKRKGRKVAR